MATIYETNFSRGETGNVLKAGDTLTVKIEGASWAQCAIYENGMPITTDFDDNRDGKVECNLKTLKWKGSIGDYDTFPSGKYELKTRAWINNRMQGWNDIFEIVS